MKTRRSFHEVRCSRRRWLAPCILVAMLLWLPRFETLGAETFIAYAVPAGTAANQTGLGMEPIGMDFEVANEIVIKRLGVFDDDSDGLTEGTTLTARIWDRSQDPPAEVASISFDSTDAGELIAGSRFKALATPLRLPAGFRGTISVDGWVDTDSIVNSFGDLANVIWTTNSGHGSVAFVGASRYGGTIGDFPGTVDTGPAARFAAGTFEFETTELVAPGRPQLSIAGGDKKIDLSWPEITEPAPATKYIIKRADTAAGPFSQVAEVTTAGYSDTGLANGTARSYIVQAVSAQGKVADSEVKTAAAYVLDPSNFIAYFVPASKPGNYTSDIAFGFDFDVLNPVIVRKLGVFDNNSDGIKSEAGINVRLFDRDTQTELAALTFTADSPGVLIEGMRFKDLATPLRLEGGFHGVIAEDGLIGGDPAFTSFGNLGAIFWTLDTGNGSIAFVGSSRNGTPGQFPANAYPAGAPVARVAAGTFLFEALPPEVVGTPIASVVLPAEDKAVTLQWNDVQKPLPAVKYEVRRSTDSAGPFTKVGETTIINFRDTTVQNGTRYFYVVRAIGGAGQFSDSLVVSVPPHAAGPGIAYIVPANLPGNQSLAKGGVGMDFDVKHPIKVTRLGVFDDGSDGLNMELTAVLFDRASRKALATLVFGPEKQGELVGGSRFLPLDTPLVLDEGFQGSIVLWFSDDTTEKLFNYGIGAAPPDMDLQTYDGGAIVFVGSGRYGTAGAFPPTVDGGPASRYAASTFEFEPTTVDHPSVIAYSVPAGSVGNQGVKGAALGMDFQVENEIVVTRLGVFDDGSDGIKQTMTARLWDRDPAKAAPVQIGVLEFTPDSPGDLVGGSRFKPLPENLRLPRGFQGTISVDYNDNLEKTKNSNGNAADVTWALNDGNGSLLFVGSSRYGGANGFPATVDGGPAARFASGTFEFRTTPPARPGTPVVTVQRPFENGQVTLNWLAVANPLPAAKYEVLRRNGAADFAKIGETMEVTYRDLTVQNGTTYDYVVRAVAAGGEVGNNSSPVSARPDIIRGGIAYIVPAGLAGNQPLGGASVGMDFDVVTPIKVTQLGVFDAGSDGIKMSVTSVLYDRINKQILASQEFAPGNEGNLIGGSRFLSLAQPVTLDAGFQGSIVMWFSNGSDETLYNSFGDEALAAVLQTFDGGSIRFVGASRYGSAGGFPGTVDGGPVNRYAAATFAFDPATGVLPPVLQFSLTDGKLKLTWGGGGTLERSDVLGTSWQPVVGAVSGIEIPVSGNAGFFRVSQ